MGKRISVIHPSRERAVIAQSVRDKWIDRADGDIEYFISIDSTDETKKKYHDLFPPCEIIENDNNSAIQAINHAAKLATGDILLVCSDDFDCPRHWDTELLKHIGDRTDFVAKTQDGLQNWLITLPIMDREYYNRLGYIYNPDYNHLFCDTEMTVVGDLLGKTINIPMLFPHRHHTQPGGIPKDDVSKKNDATWAQGQAVFLNRARKVFDLPAELVKGGVKDPTYKLWMAKHGVVV